MDRAAGSHRLANSLGTEKGKSSAATVLSEAAASSAASSARGVGLQYSIVRVSPPRVSSLRISSLKFPRVTQVFLSGLAPL
jgi:hypothetical protein